jgi:hypothetical protein
MKEPGIHEHAVGRPENWEDREICKPVNEQLPERSKDLDAAVLM